MVDGPNAPVGGDGDCLTTSAIAGASSTRDRRRRVPPAAALLASTLERSEAPVDGVHRVVVLKEGVDLVERV
jgi:hypothetical protein